MDAFALRDVLMTLVRRVGIVAIVAIGTFALTGFTSSAADAVPDDVRELFAEDGLTFLELAEGGTEIQGAAQDETAAPDFSSVDAFGPIFEVHGWSAEFVAGEPGASFESYSEWVSSLLNADGSIAGTMSVFRAAPGADAELAGFNNDIDLGETLVSLDPDATLVTDPSIGAWYRVTNGTITALNENGEIEVPSAMPVDDYQAVFVARIGEAIEMGGGAEDAAGSGVSPQRAWYDDPLVWALSGGVAAALLGGVVLWRFRRRDL